MRRNKLFIKKFLNGSACCATFSIICTLSVNVFATKVIKAFNIEQRLYLHRSSQFVYPEMFWLMFWLNVKRR